MKSKKMFLFLGGGDRESAPSYVESGREGRDKRHRGTGHATMWTPKATNNEKKIGKKFEERRKEHRTSSRAFLIHARRHNADADGANWNLWGERLVNASTRRNTG